MDEDEERTAKLANLMNYKAEGEKAYDEMYEAHSFGHAGACYSDAKDFFYEAIKLAEELGMVNEAASITKRLELQVGLQKSVCPVKAQAFCSTRRSRGAIGIARNGRPRCWGTRELRWRIAGLGLDRQKLPPERPLSGLSRRLSKFVTFGSSR